MECTLCKRQYTGISETAFNIRLNNHRNDVHKTNMPEADQHFRLPGHNFNRHAKFTLIEQSNNTEFDKELLTFGLKKRKDFWIHKLKYGFNSDLISLTPKSSAFLVQISFRWSYVEGTVIILRRSCTHHSRRKNDVKFVNNNIC